MGPSIVTDGIGAIRRRVADLTSDGRGWILLTISFGWFLGLGTRLAAPALVPYIRADFGMDLSISGLLLSTLWITYAITQLPGGILGDRIGERNVLVTGAGLGIAAVVAAALAWSPLALFGAFVLLGSATGIYATTRFTSLVDVYPRNAATATGICSAAGNVGTVVLPAGAGLLAAAFTWPVGFAAVAPLFALAAVGLWVAVPSYTSSQESAMDDLSLGTLRDLAAGLSNRRIVIFTAAMFLMSAVYQGFTSFYPSYLVEIKLLSESAAALVYSVFFAAGILIQPLAGGLADALGDRPTMVGFSAATALGFVGLVLANGFWPLIGISVVLGSQLGFWPITQAGVVEELPTDLQGTGFGLLRTIYLLLAATTPAIVGALGDSGFFDEAFLLLAGLALLAATFGLALGQRQ